MENLRQRAQNIQNFVREYNPPSITRSRSEEEGKGSREGRRTNPRKLESLSYLPLLSTNTGYTGSIHSKYISLIVIKPQALRINL